MPTVLAADEQAAAAVSVLASLQHPSQLQLSNLVPSLQTALLSLHQPPSGRGWEREVLASPLLLGLLSWATALLEQPQAAALGPEASLLLLEALSHLGSASPLELQGGATRQALHCRRLWRHAHAAFGDAADEAGVWVLVRPDHMTPEMTVRYYEACARGSLLTGAPSKSRGLGLLLRSQLKNKLFTVDENVRLLAAWAQLRRRMPFNPDSYNFAALSSSLTASTAQLSSQQLQLVAAAATAFQWPVYRSMPLLHAVCREAMHRSLAGTMQLPAAQRTLAAAVKGVAAMHPRLAHELQAATIEWMRDAPTASSGSPDSDSTQTMASAAAADECSNNALPCGGASQRSTLVGPAA